MAYRGKEKNISLAKTKRINIIQKIKKSKGLQDQKKLIIKFQTLKEIIKKHLNLKIQWYKKKFKALINSRVTRNYILLKIVERLGILYK